MGNQGNATPNVLIIEGPFRWKTNLYMSRNGHLKLKNAASPGEKIPYDLQVWECPYVCVSY